MLNREQFLEASDLKREPVGIEGLGTVVMRELSIGEQLDAQKRHGTDEGDEVAESLALVAVSLCNENGTPMFASDEIADAVSALRAKSKRVVEALQKAFLRLNGLSDEDVEQAVGNSTEIPCGSSSTGSRGISDTQPSGALRAS